MFNAQGGAHCFALRVLTSFLVNIHSTADRLLSPKPMEKRCCFE
ncbi:hypothetical protein ACFYZ5_43340 [Streptomyces chartreusis]